MQKRAVSAGVIHCGILLRCVCPTEKKHVLTSAEIAICFDARAMYVELVLPGFHLVFNDAGRLSTRIGKDTGENWLEAHSSSVDVETRALRYLLQIV